MDARAIGRLTLGECAVMFGGWREANSGPSTPRAPSIEAHENADWNW